MDDLSHFVIVSFPSASTMAGEAVNTCRNAADTIEQVMADSRMRVLDGEIFRMQGRVLIGSKLAEDGVARALRTLKVVGCERLIP